MDTLNRRSAHPGATRRANVRGRAARLLLGAALCTVACGGARAATSDHELKAAVIARLTQFIEWPDTAPGAGAPPAPFAICVFGDSPVREPLERLPRLLTVKDRPLVVRRIEQPRDGAACDMVFVGSTANAVLPSIQSAVRGQPVLLVNETPDDPGHGQIVTLYTDVDRLRIAIHLRAANDAGFKISARLLKLADVVD